MVRNALKATEERRFFHWELEFPEVFYGPRPGTQKTIERLGNGGFDAVVGNPPYVRQESLKQDKPYFSTEFRDTFDAVNDLYVYFLHREIQLLRPGGLVGLIVANKWLRVDYGRRLRAFLIREASPVSIVDFGHSSIFPDADTFPCVPIFTKRRVALAAGEAAADEEKVMACLFPRAEYSPNAEISTYVLSKGTAIPTFRSRNGF